MTWCSCRFGRWLAMLFMPRFKQGRLAHWFLLGIAFGGTLCAKYSSSSSPCPMCCSCCSTGRRGAPSRRPDHGSRSPSRSLIASPHLVWLLQTDFLPLAYASHRATAGARLVRSRFAPGDIHGEPDVFSAAVAVHCGCAVLAEAECAFRSFSESFDRRIVTLLAFGPGLDDDRA